MSEGQIIKIRDWITDSVNSLISVIRILLLSKFKVAIKKQYDGDVVILGNGPSLPATIAAHRKFLEGKQLLCVNLFSDTDHFEQLKPKHYVVVSPNMWSGKPDPRTVENRRKVWSSLAKKTSWPMQLYLPYEADRTKDWKEIIRSNANIRVVYFNRTPVDGHGFLRHFLFKKGYGMPRPHNVIIPSLFLSVNLGFDEIYLIGADHSWLPETSVDDENNVLVCQKHFYDENEARPEGMIKNNEGLRKLHEVLEKWMISFKSYFIIREYAESQNVKIWNATPGSFIDAFDRIKLG